MIRWVRGQSNRNSEAFKVVGAGEMVLKSAANLFGWVEECWPLTLTFTLTLALSPRERGLTSVGGTFL